MVKKIVLYVLAAVSLTVTLATVDAISTMPANSIYYNDSLVIMAAFITGIAFFIFVPISIAAALVLRAHDAL